MMEKLQKLDGFVLKILAMIFMTLDHIGVFLMMVESTYKLGLVFRCIGRVAFPLFVLLLVEGIRHSKNVYRYILRIATLAITVMIAEVLIYYLYDTSISVAQSPLMDLLFCGLTLMLLHRKDKWSFLAILPIAFILTTTGVQIFELATEKTVIWLPFYLRPGYSLFALLLSLGFYYSSDIVLKMFKKTDLDTEAVQETLYFRRLVNISQIGVLFTVNILIFVLSFIDVNNIAIFDIYISSVETWSVFAALLILFYNGRRGYNSKWFQYGCYLYFPVHIVIIFLLFTLL